MDISKMSVTELKASAFDHLVNIERIQNSLNAVNAEINARSNGKQEYYPETEEPKETK